MNVTEAIRNRRSIRNYTGDTNISDEEIKIILEAAMMAPSAKNTRPWSFIVVKSDEAKKKVYDIHPYAKHISTAAIGIIVCADPASQEDICPNYYPQDCGAAIENILLQSLELGYGTCWCGIYPREERVQPFKEAFGIKDTPIGIVIIGKADEQPDAKGFYDENKVKFV